MPVEPVEPEESGPVGTVLFQLVWLQQLKPWLVSDWVPQPSA